MREAVGRDKGVLDRKASRGDMDRNRRETRMYTAPVAEIAHTLKHLTGLGDAVARGEMGDLSEDVLDAILEEAGRFASEEVAPMRGTGDKHGTPLADGVVTMPPGWKETYQAWIEGGWNALTGPESHGGQGLPQALGAAASEMWNAGSFAFGLGPMLTGGAIEALAAHASDDLKDRFLDRLVEGSWTGTMNLTEPQAGSDLNALKAKAIPAGDGTYRIFGQKIYITFGEHDMTENILHLVLARLPDAPAGTRGISLFLVPKFLVNDDGSIGTRNDVFCNGVEEKLGIHASPTCTMIYGDGKFGPEKGAVGYLIGEENKGLRCMFTMMNNARLLVGVQGVAVADAAFQKARAYAHDRKQGAAPGYEGDGMAPIVHHPDVQRMLLTMQAMTQAARAICYNCAFAIDLADRADMVSARGAASDASADVPGSYWNDRAGLLTPIAKAFSTDIGCEIASLGVQVHGGMGFVEETGAAQLMRDARIAPIYEGTNGIQAIDLVQRKLPLGGGDAVRGYIAELGEMSREARTTNRPKLTHVADGLDAALEDLSATTEFMLSALESGDTQAALAGATPYLRLFGLAAGGAYLARSAVKGGERRDGLAEYFAMNHLPETAGLRRTVENGAASLRDAGEMLLAG